MPEVGAGPEPIPENQREQLNYENVDCRDESVGRLVHSEIRLPQGRLRPHAAAGRDFNISYPVRRLP